VWISTCAVSVIVLIFAEILPKTYAMNNTLPLALKTTPLLSGLVWFFRPFVRALNWLSKKAMVLLPHTKNLSDPDEQLKAEIRGALAMQNADVLPHEKGMLKSVLDLDEVCVGDVKLHRSKVVSLNANMPLEEVFRFVTQTSYSRIPVYKGRRDNIVGILHAKSVMKMMPLFYEKKANISLLDYCTKPWFVLNTISLLDQLVAFKKRREHFAIIVDEYGDWEGILTLEDLLEEIVGDISDETDELAESTFHWEKTSAGGYMLDGAATIRDINRYFHWELSDENAATLAGYVMYHLERIPNKGQTFVINDWTFVVHEKVRNQLSKIEVIPPPLT
jgi:Mg2+/Co2+ transporter CorB